MICLLERVVKRKSDGRVIAWNQTSLMIRMKPFSIRMGTILALNGEVPFLFAEPGGIVVK
jgi:hypothetical protein